VSFLIAAPRALPRASRGGKTSSSKHGACKRFNVQRSSAANQVNSSGQSHTKLWASSGRRAVIGNFFGHQSLVLPSGGPFWPEMWGTLSSLVLVLVADVPIPMTFNFTRLVASMRSHGTTRAHLKHTLMSAC